MTETKLHADGACLFWTLAESFDRNKLLCSWSAIGLNEAVPEPRAAVACLKDALVEVFGSRRCLIRPLSAKNGFSVVVEDRGEDGNNYSTLLTAKVYEEQKVNYTGNVEKMQEVNSAYFRHLGRLPSAQVGAALVKVLGKFGATRLRPTGGIYWLKGARLNEWQSAIAGVESAAVDGRAIGYVIKHDLDAESIVAVRDAIIHEVSVEAARLESDIQSGELGERGIKTRKAEAGALRQKVSEYEKLLGVGLEELRKTLDRVEQTNAVAALLLSANPFETSSENSHVVA